MISHQFIEGRSRTDFLQYTLQITTNNLVGDNLISLVNYLIENVQVIYDKFPDMLEEVMWPIEIKLIDGTTYSESVFWRLVFEKVPNAFEYLNKYIATLCELAKVTEFDMLLQSNEYQFHGGLAVSQYWNWCLEYPVQDSKQIAISMDYFVLWLSRNDLGHEVNQDDLISLVFTHFRQTNKDASAALLALRLNDGQDIEKSFDYLLESMRFHGLKSDFYNLKQVIDQLVEGKLIYPGLSQYQYLYSELCAVLYGSCQTATQKVISYVQNKTKKDLVPIKDRHMRRLNYLRQIADIYWQNFTSQDRYIDTSFHLFDTHTKKWIDYSEREDD